MLTEEFHATPNSELPAFANPGSEQGPGSMGLTKREYFAAMAMQGLVNVFNAEHSPELARRSIIAADELLKALASSNKEGGRKCIIGISIG